MINIIIDSDIDVNIKDTYGNTVLHYAVLFRRLNVIMILLQNDANVSIKNNEGYTPIDLVEKDLLYNIKGATKDELLNILTYRKKKTFKINSSVALYGKHDNLININNEKELEKVKGSKGILLFYMVKCGWCKKMQPDIIKLCERGTKVYVMESAQLTSNIRQQFEVNSFPSIFIIKNKQFIRYNGDRTYQSFEKFLN